MRKIRARTRRLVAASIAAWILAWPGRPAAHDIPADILVQMFVKPEGQRLTVLIRVPLVAMRDASFPTHGPGFLDLARTDTLLHDAATTWIAHDLELYEDDVRVRMPQLAGARVSLPGDRSFTSFEQASEHLRGPTLEPSTDVYWNQALLDARFEYDITSDRSRFAMRPTLARLGLRVVTALRYLPPGGGVRAFEYVGDPGLVRLDPRWHQAALQFVQLGFRHILGGIDHLLFLLGLVIPFRRFRQLVIVVTSFTAAHSLTLIGSAMNAAPIALWFPPLIETLIAASILYMALENVAGAMSLQRRWTIAFAFGLVHGFGFSFALRQSLQFAGSYLLSSLVAFNVGVELGQLLVLALLVPALQFLFRFVVAERVGTIILSILVGHTAWHWMVERFDRLRQFEIGFPDPVALLTIVRWLIVAVLIAGVAWAGRLAVRRVRALRNS